MKPVSSSAPTRGKKANNEVASASGPLDVEKAKMEYASLKFVRLKKYCELTGETPEAVHARRKTSQWVDGLHCEIGPDRKLWVNLEEAQKWVTNGTTLAH